MSIRKRRLERLYKNNPLLIGRMLQWFLWAYHSAPDWIPTGSTRSGMSRSVRNTDWKRSKSGEQRLRRDDKGFLLDRG